MGSDSDGKDSRIVAQARERGLITPAQIQEAEIERARIRASGGPVPGLSEILVRKGHLSSDAFQRLSGAAAAAPAQVFGKYRLQRELGRGGMGVVWDALDTELNRRVALKMMLGNPHPDPMEAKNDEERFQREAKLSASLPRHPGIVGVYEAGVLEGRRYLAMEFIDGRPMSEWTKSGSITLRQQVQVLRDVALAVHHAHEHQVVHRDLKPANILVDRNGRPHVTDFGLAKALAQDVSVSLTASGMVMGTPAYMSPEQARGLKTLDARTDVYSMGVMLYEMLTGRPPFTGETAIDILMKVVKSPPPRPASVRPNCDRALEAVCLKALSKRPADRHGSADEFASDLTAWLLGKPVSAPSPTRRAAPPSTSTRKIPWAPIGAGAAALLGVFILAALTSKSSPPARPETIVVERKVEDTAARKKLEEELRIERERARKLEEEMAARKAAPVPAPAPAPAEPPKKTAPPVPRAPKGLIAHWTFDEGQGTIAGDSGPHRLMAHLKNGASWKSGRIGNALALDGVDDHARVETAAVLADLGDELTLAVWVKEEARTEEWSSILCRQWGAGLADQFSLLLAKGSIPMAIVQTDGLGGSVRGTEPIAPRWTHLAIVKGSGMLSLYVDAKFVVRAKAEGSLLREPKPVVIGGGINGADDRVTEHFRGLIDDVRIYTKALSGSEIEALVASAPPEPAPPRADPEAGRSLLWSALLEHKAKLAGLPLDLQKPGVAGARFTVRDLTAKDLVLDMALDGATARVMEPASTLPAPALLALLRKALPSWTTELRTAAAFRFAEEGAFDEAYAVLPASDPAVATAIALVARAELARADALKAGPEQAAAYRKLQMTRGSVWPEASRAELSVRLTGADRAVKLQTGLYSARLRDRAAAASRGGGGADTEAAVSAALRWLARHQSADGGWKLTGYTEACARGRTCAPNPGYDDFGFGVSGLALLAFLGAGHTPASAETHDGIRFGEVVRKGLAKLMEAQDPQGCVGSRNSQKMMYNHLIGTQALAEAHALVGGNEYREAARRAFDFTIAAQNPGAAWRYIPRSNDNDTSILGWGASALKAGEAAGFAVPRAASEGVSSWLDQVEDEWGRMGYTHKGTGKVFVPGLNEQYDHHEALAAIGLLSRLFMVKERTDLRFGKAADLLLRDLPRWDGTATDLYYTYYGSAALFQFDGPSGARWRSWNAALRKALLPSQNGAGTGCRAGSWEPIDRWAGEGGRIYTTAMAALALQTYYRFAR